MRAAIKGKRLDEGFGDSLALAVHEQQYVREGTRELMQVFPLLIRGMPGATTPVSAAELDHMMPGDLLFFRMEVLAPETRAAQTDQQAHRGITSAYARFALHEGYSPCMGGPPPVILGAQRARTLIFWMIVLEKPFAAAGCP